MKKSNALMLSYIIILLITIFVDAFSAWSGMDQVALAATMAGFFFAIADYAGWRASYNQTMVDSKKEYLNTYKTYLNDVLDMARKDGAVVNEVMVLLDPYRNSHESVVEVLEKNNELAAVIDRKRTEAKESLENFPNKMEDVAKKEKEIQDDNRKESIYATVGFLVFFILIIFDKFAEFLMPLGSITTVGAFCIIMLTYFSKDLYEAKSKKDIAKTAALVQEMREQAAKYRDDLHGQNLLENAKSMISAIEKSIYENEEPDNG